jgi:hypothetical protein
MLKVTTKKRTKRRKTIIDWYNYLQFVLDSGHFKNGYPLHFKNPKRSEDGKLVAARLLCRLGEFKIEGGYLKKK